jgi:hypothetical protein
MEYESNKEIFQLYAAAAKECTHFYTAHTRFKTLGKEAWLVEAYKKHTEVVLHKMHNALVRRIHGYDYKKKPLETEVVMLTAVEVAGKTEDPKQTVHVHILLGRLNGKHFSSTELAEIKQVLDDAWKKTDVYGKVTHLEETTKNQELGALTYSDKGRTKRWYGEGVNFNHCWLPANLLSLERIAQCVLLVAIAKWLFVIV